MGCKKALVPLKNSRHPHLNITYEATRCLKDDRLKIRHHSPKQVRQIARSIELFGCIVPLIVDSERQVIVGQGRLQACRYLGVPEVPVIQIDHLTEEQIAAFRIADNKLTDNSEWNERLLAETFLVLSTAKLEFELEATGFEMGEIDLRIQGLTLDAKNADAADAVPELLSQPAVSRLEDLWTLNDHRVFCGDALSGASYAALMDGARAQMAITDFPYNVSIRGHVTTKGNHREFVMGSGEWDSPEFTRVLTTAMRNIFFHSEPGTVLFGFMDWRHMEEILAAGRAADAVLLNLVVWVKDNGGMGSLYRSQHELVFVFKNGKAPHHNNIQLGKFGRYRTNVWQYPGANTFARASDEGDLTALHPTVKPVKLIADAMLDCSHRGEIVLDPFLGSGTAIMAAERTGRLCYGMELDPLYVDVAIRRWQAYTGGDAVHAASGKTFNQLVEEAAHDR